MGRPFEIADAQALLRHLEAALPSAIKRPAECDVAGTAKIYLAHRPSGNIEFSPQGPGPGSLLRDTLQIAEPDARALHADLDVVLDDEASGREQ